MNFLKKHLSPSEYKKLQATALPSFVSPMLATLTDDYFDDDNWIFERKLDGIRCLVHIDGHQTTLYSRNQNNLTKKYREIQESLDQDHYPPLLLDGEIVAFEGNTTSFSKLQRRGQEQKKGNRPSKVYLYLFDIIYYEKDNLQELPLRTRKKILKKVIHWKEQIRFTPHRNTKGKTYFKEACDNNWEGIIAKEASASYQTNRSKKWLKFKCINTQELVIGGFSNPHGEREGFGALLVGYYNKKGLQYAGKVGTGFDHEFLRTWSKKLHAIEQRESPFENFQEDTYHWVAPKYVGQFGFTEWTQDNKLRHPRFLGIRHDKNPQEVYKEKVL